LPRRRRAGNHGAATSRRFAALPPPHDLAGLIAWAKRDEWRGALAELLERHCAEACAGAGIMPEEIEDVLGDHAATVLWGAAFEDLVATDLPGGRNLADDYLRRRGRGGARGRHWHVDETHLRVRGRWTYLYRAIDRDGNLVDTMLNERRDMTAARAFFRSAKVAKGVTPERVTTDGHGSYPRAIRTVLGRRVVHRTSAYRNNCRGSFKAKSP